MSGRRHVYYVSYSHPRGHGAVELVSLEPYTRFEQLNEAAEVARGYLPYPTRPGDVVVLNYILLRSEPVS